MFRNDLERNKEIKEARTSVTLSSEPPAQPRASKQKARPRVQRDLIADLKARQDHEKDPRRFWHRIDREKMIHIVADGGVNPNHGPAGWGAIIRQSGRVLRLRDE
jgi:hypothetical protein